jgi:hypothetical protein
MHETDKSKINAKGSDSFESLNPIPLQMWSVEQIKQNVFLPVVTKHVLRFYFMIYYKKHDEWINDADWFFINVFRLKKGV